MRVAPRVALAVDGPWDPAHALRFLAARAVPGLERVEGTAYRRGELVVELGGTDVVELWTEARGPVARTRVEEAIPRARRLLGLDRDVLGAVAALRGDPVLGPLVRTHPGVRPCGAWSVWEATVRAVVGQQVSVAGARTVLGRLLDREGRLPSADALAGLPLEAFPMPRARARALRSLAALDWSAEPDDLVDSLLAAPGIGPWTAAYVRLRGLGDDDAWPGTDLILRRAVAESGADPERWRPWRAWGATHLWNRAARAPAVSGRRRRPGGAGKEV